MALITLWLFVISLGLNLGAGLYEAESSFRFGPAEFPRRLRPAIQPGVWPSTQAFASGRI